MIWCKNVLPSQDIFVKNSILYFFFYYRRDYKNSLYYQGKDFPYKRAGHLEMT